MQHVITGKIRIIADSQHDAETICGILRAFPKLVDLLGVTISLARPHQGRRAEWLAYGVVEIEIDNPSMK